MKKTEYNHIASSKYRKNVLMFIQTLEEVLFFYSFESYKMSALNSHFLCLDLLTTKNNIDKKVIMEGNFVPLAEEFEAMLEDDIVIKTCFPDSDTMLKQRDKLGAIIDYSKAENKAKIKKYSEVAEYIHSVETTNDFYLSTIFNLLQDSIFRDKSVYENQNDIYLLTRILVTELVNGGYNPEYIYQEMKYVFLNNRRTVECDRNLFTDFLNRFTFEGKKYQIILGINAETARILKNIEGLNVKEPTKDVKLQLNLRHKGDCVVELYVKSVDKQEAANKGYDYLETIIGLHRISQHHKPLYIRLVAQVNEIDDANKVLSSRTVKIGKNVLLRANNESQLQAHFFDKQLLNNVNPPVTFFRAVSLHNSALDSKEPTNQLLDLWTAVETLIGFKNGEEDKINFICDILTSVLCRTYLYDHMTQLYKDIVAVLGEVGSTLISNVEGNEQTTWKMAKILSLKSYQSNYIALYELLEEYPILQYRMERFSSVIFKDSKSVYDELVRHKKKLRWQIMRIYRNRNKIVHNGEYMPYLNIILGNLHYYVDAIFDLLIEYYHMGLESNKHIFYDVQREEQRHWRLLGLDEKGKNVKAKAITEENYISIIFNEYEGNTIKNVVKQAIAEMDN